MSDAAQEPGPEATAAGDRQRASGHAIQKWLVGAALLAELVALVGHPLFGWGTPVYRATPGALSYLPPEPPSGASVLLTLAESAQLHAPASSESSHDRYAFVRRRTWSVGGEPSATPAATVRSSVNESWLGSDGAGRILTITSGPAGPATHTTVLRSGRPLPVLSARQATLASHLGLGYPVPAPAVNPFAEATAVTSREPVAGPAQAALLRLLARVPALVNSGSTVDRAGRPGIAVTINSSYRDVPARFTLVFDSATGALQEEDVTLTGDPGSLHVRPGSVVSYTTFLAAGWVAGTSAVP